MTGGAEERFGREEEEGVRTIFRETIGPWVLLRRRDTPLPLLGGGETGRESSHWPQGHLSSEKLNSWGVVMMFGVISSHP